MKTLWKVLKIVFVSLAALVLLVCVSVFIYHHFQLNKEAALLKGKGTVVDVDGKKYECVSRGKREGYVCVYVRFGDCSACL